MVNLGKTFSILVVFILLILLAPVAILAPPVASAASVADLPNPLTVNFTATVYEGDNYSFQVIPNATCGSVINQFSRDWMVINRTLHNETDARFFNMSTAPGTISGDLSGSINFKWNRLDFNLSHFNSSEWFIDPPDGIGLLYINATLTTSPLGDLTIVGAADLDYNSTLVKGEGIVWTVEDWAEGTTQAPSRVLIGEMSYEYVVSTGAMTGTFNLRHYSQNPVGLEGVVNTTGEWIYLEGQLISEKAYGDDDEITDDVVKFIQFSRDPVMTDSGDGFRIVFEEMPAGREAPQSITAGDIGTGGTISLLRSGVIDGYDLSPTIDVPVNSVTATRTIEDNTGSNISSKRGVAKTIVLVDMVDFDMHVGVSQQAFTGMPGYSWGYDGPYAGTGYYAGFESYVVAATFINLTLWLEGPDYRYSLLPTPLVSSVDPDEGWVGDSLTVTINGKWFWTNTSYHPLNIDFGSGVTADWQNCTVVNDTAVKVNITIDSDAMVCPRDVSVEKRGVKGTLTNGFNVKGPTGNLTGQVNFKRKNATGNPDWETGLVVTFFDNSTRNLLYTKNVTTDAYGNFILVVGRGTYDIAVKNWTSLSKMAYGQEFTGGNDTPISWPELTESDTDNNDDIRGADFNRVLVSFWDAPGDDGWNAMYDFDRSKRIDGADFNLVLTNYNEKGDLYYY